MASTQPPPLNRRSSSISSQALDVLAILETDVTAFETGQAKAEQVLQNVGPNPDEAGCTTLIDARNQLRQHAGDLEKFQCVRVDAVVTADLNSGKNEAKLRRKQVNARCEVVRERQQALMVKMNTVIKRVQP